MITLLARIFIKDRDNVNQPSVRKAYGILCGTVGILLNFILFAGKLTAGILTGSIAITADAFNNLSDAGSSVITMAGFHLAGQKPDPDHPFGHGRFEYISGFVVSMAVLLMGFELASSSFDKILHPEKVEMNLITVAILVSAIIVKLYMAFYNKKIGAKINSSAMSATATDSLSDSVSTAAVLAAMLIAHFTGWMIDGWCGLAVAVFIFIAGIKAAKETVSPLLGQPPEPEFVHQILDMVSSHPEVIGIHDMIVHNYGPGRVMISLHAEVSAKSDFLAIHDTIDNIEHELTSVLGCPAVIHMDPIVVDDEVLNEAKAEIAQNLKKIDENVTMHDFRMVMGPTHTNLIFDVVVPYEVRMSDEEIKEKVAEIVSEVNKDYRSVIEIDRNYVKR